MENITEIAKYFNSMTPEEIELHDIEVLAQIAEQEKREANERYRKSGVPERYWDITLDGYRTDSEMQLNAHKCAIAYTTEIQRGEFKSFVMIGNAGTGKTHLGCGILREYGWGLYRTAPDIVEELRRAKSFTASESEAQIIKHYGQTPLLVIDEIGRGIAATDEKYMLYQVLNARYNTRKPTVLISNHTKTDFLKYIGVAAADRLVESAELVEMNGESYRRELRAK